MAFLFKDRLSLNSPVIFSSLSDLMCVPHACLQIFASIHLMALRSLLYEILDVKLQNLYLKKTRKCFINNLVGQARTQEQKWKHKHIIMISSR